MQKLIMFNNVTLDGCFADAQGDVSWAHSDDPELNEFVSENASGNGKLLMGRVTYEMMASYWPTPMAAANNPVVAEGMNRMTKIVFSRTMNRASWINTKLMKSDLVTTVRKIKSESGPGLAILGSGSIVTQLAPEGLIDEYQLVVHPIVMGSGRPLFGDLQKRLDLKLSKTRTFRSGKVYLCYEKS